MIPFGKKSLAALSFSATLFLILCFVSGCAVLGLKKKPTYPVEVTEEMRLVFEQAERAYQDKNFDEAFSRYRGYIERFGYNRLSDEASYKIGKIFFLRKSWVDAANEFEKLAHLTPDPVLKAKAYYMAGYAALGQPDYDRAAEDLDHVDEEALTAKFRIHFYSLRIFMAEKTNLPREARDYEYLRLVDTYEANPDLASQQLDVPHLISQAEAMRRLSAFVIAPLSSEAIPGWFGHYPEGFSKPYVEYKWGKIYFEAGKQDAARRKLIRFVQAYPKHEYAESARQLLQKLGGVLKEGKSDEALVRVGVLLPLSGPQGSYGAAVLWGVECAAGRKGGCETFPQFRLKGKPQKVELIIRDSGMSPEEVIGRVDELAQMEISAIVGPITGPLSEAAAKRAQELKILLLPITQKRGMMEMGDYIFQMGYTVDQQMEDLVRESSHRGLRSFAVFYPNMSYGQEMADLFSNAVSAAGGRIVAKAFYEGGGDMVSQVRKLKMNLRVFSGSGSSGFRAIFIPDSYRVMPQVIEGLKLSSVEGIPLVGTNAWNDPVLATALGDSYPGSFFLDVFYPGASDSMNVGFTTAYKEAFGRAPTSLEALGFDALLFVQQAVEASGDPKTSRVRDSLALLTDLKGVTRISSFEPGKRPVIKPYILTVGPSGIVQLR